MNEVLRLNFEGASTCDEICSNLLHSNSQHFTSNSQRFSSDSMLIASHLVWKLRKPLPNRYCSVDNFSPDSLRRRFILLEHVTQIPIDSHFRGTHGQVSGKEHVHQALEFVGDVESEALPYHHMPRRSTTVLLLQHITNHLRSTEEI